MAPIRNITQVTLDNLHELIPEYIHNNKTIIQNYDDMKEVYLSMLRDRYLFTLDRDILVNCLTDLTYMFAPGDDLNKDAVLELLDYGDDEEDDEDEDEGDNVVVQEVEEAWSGGEEGVEVEEEVNKTIFSLSEKKNEDCPGGM
tara:strand:+ start:195 stop:623 length:429 start_codon:yes stop_codon:yes gene_type:complete